MSAMLIVLLSGLSLFGAVLIDPQEMSNEADEEAIPTPEEPVEGGSNPVDEATQSPVVTTSDEGSTIDPEPTPEPETDLSSAEADTITGSQQSDTLNGEAGDDVIFGRLGDDTIHGGVGADSIEGGEGADVLYGGDLDESEDGEVDTLIGGAGTDEIHLGDADVATGGADADTFVRLNSMSSRALITDFDTSEDLVVIEHESDTPPTLLRQTVASDGVILELSDGSQIELAGLDAEIDTSLISFVDTRATP